MFRRAMEKAHHAPGSSPQLYFFCFREGCITLALVMQRCIACRVPAGAQVRILPRPTFFLVRGYCTAEQLYFLRRQQYRSRASHAGYHWESEKWSQLALAPVISQAVSSLLWNQGNGTALLV